MAFKIEYNLAGGNIEVAAPKDLQLFQMTASEAGVMGSVYKFGSGLLTLADDGNEKAAAVVAMENVGAADPGNYIRGYWILPGMVFKAPITDKDGSALTALQAGVVQGATVTINDTGDGVDGETDNAAVNGPLTVIKVDEDNELIWVAFNTCALKLDTDTQG